MRPIELLATGLAGGLTEPFVRPVAAARPPRRRGPSAASQVPVRHEGKRWPRGSWRGYSEQITEKG